MRRGDTVSALTISTHSRSRSSALNCTASQASVTSSQSTQRTTTSTSIYNQLWRTAHSLDGGSSLADESDGAPSLAHRSAGAFLLANSQLTTTLPSLLWYTEESTRSPVDRSSAQSPALSGEDNSALFSQIYNSEIYNIESAKYLMNSDKEHFIRLPGVGRVSDQIRW